MRARLALVLGALVATEAAGSAVLGGAVRALAGELAQPGVPPVDPAVGLAAAVLGWLVLTWLVGVTALAALAQWSATTDRGPTGPGPSTRAVTVLAERCSPASVRRVAAVLLGAGVAAAVGASGPALAQERGPAVAAAAVPGVAGIGSLDRPAPPDRLSGLPVGAEVVVRRGDTLWDIAARHLGPGSGAAEIAAEWPRWHSTNRGVIGPDPDLLRPGQRLRAPAALEGPDRHPPR